MLETCAWIAKLQWGMVEWTNSNPLQFVVKFKLPVDRTAQRDSNHCCWIRLHGLDVSQLFPTSILPFCRVLTEECLGKREFWHSGRFKNSINYHVQRMYLKTKGWYLYLSAFLSVALSTNGFWWIQMNLLLVPESPYYLCLLPCYYTSFARLDNHYAPHGEARSK